MAAPDLAILLVHTGQSSSLIGQNAEADTVPACLPQMKYRVWAIYTWTFDAWAIDILTTDFLATNYWTTDTRTRVYKYTRFS